MIEAKRVSQLAIAGAVLVLLGLLTGLITGAMVNPRLGLSAHLQGLMNGMLLIAIAGIWRRRVKLSRREERWAVNLLVFASYGNWATTLLAAIWGTSRMTPIAGAGHAAMPWQESIVMILLLALAVAMIAGLVLLIRGLVKARTY